MAWVSPALCSATVCTFPCSRDFSVGPSDVALSLFQAPAPAPSATICPIAQSIEHSLTPIPWYFNSCGSGFGVSHSGALMYDKRLDIIASWTRNHSSAEPVFPSPCHRTVPLSFHLLNEYIQIALSKQRYRLTNISHVEHYRSGRVVLN